MFLLNTKAYCMLPVLSLWLSGNQIIVPSLILLDCHNVSCFLNFLVSFLSRTTSVVNGDYSYVSFSLSKTWIPLKFSVISCLTKSGICLSLQVVMIQYSPVCVGIIQELNQT